MLRIQKVSIGSAFRVGAILTAILFVAWMLLFFLLALAGGDFSSSSYGGYDSYSSSDFGGGSILILLCGIPFAAIFGGIFGAFYAFAYNLTAGWVGGLEVEVEQRPGTWEQVTMGKPKREDWSPPKPQNQDPYP